MPTVVRDPQLLPYHLVPDEAAALLRISVHTLVRYCRDGSLVEGQHWIRRRGRRRLFLRDGLLEFLRPTVEHRPVRRCAANLRRSPELAAAWERENGR